MSGLGDRLGIKGRPRLGEGVPQQVIAQMPTPKKFPFSGWSAGVVVTDSPRDTPMNSAFAGTQDVEIALDDALVMAPGVTLVHDETPRYLTYVFQHASVDYGTELVAVDPPYLGYRSVGPGFTWVNLALGATGNVPWNAFNIGGTLVFSNGVNKTYTRVPGAAVVTDISAQVIARTFATAFARGFAGAYTDINGFQALGVKWNAGSGSVSDWSGANSGAQLLIANQLEADMVVALRPMGFQALAVLNRRSLWLGYQTGQIATPADFQQRYIGIGCVSERTARVTQDGVIFLSDDGVFIFSINGLDYLSGPIAQLLQPIDYINLNSYSAAYQPLQQRYYLATPSKMFIYEMPRPGRPARWIVRSFLADNVLTFTEQSGTSSWDTTAGTWDSQTNSWDQMSISQSNAPPSLYYTRDTRLGKDDFSSTYNFTNQLVAQWVSPDASRDDVQTTFTGLGFEIEYTSPVEGGVIQLEYPSLDGTAWIADPDRSVVILAPSFGRSVVTVDFVPFVSLGGRFRLTILGGGNFFKIYRVNMLYDPVSSGPSVATHHV